MRRWIFAAENIMYHGGLPGVQVLDPSWLRDLLRAIKSAGKQHIFERMWFSCHNYSSNHPPSYPYDSLNPGKTIQEDWFAFLAPLKFDPIFKEETGRSVPCICSEGGWCIGDQADNRYPKVGHEHHRDFHAQVFDMFRTGVMPNGEPLPHWWFAVTPWLISSDMAGGDMQFWENGWFSRQLSGTKTLTIEAVKAMPIFVRGGQVQRQESQQSEIRGKVINGTPGQTVILSGRVAASTKTDQKNSFAFSGLPVGTYTLDIDGARSQVPDIKVDGASSVVVNLTVVPQVWKGRIVSNTSGTEPHGSASVLRVSVIGEKNLLVKVSAWEITITNRTGTKTEYGEYACEFAPLPPATWTVEPEGLGVKLDVPLDGAGIAVVEFSRSADKTWFGTPARRT